MPKTDTSADNRDDSSAMLLHNCKSKSKSKGKSKSKRKSKKANAKANANAKAKAKAGGTTRHGFVLRGASPPSCS